MSKTPPGRGAPNVPQDKSQGRPQPPSAPASPTPPAGAAKQPGRPQTPAGQPVTSARKPGTQPGVPPRGTTPSGRIPAAQQRQPIDLATRLDGQRGWLGQLENSLKKRSIIALVLTCLAVGVGAAALYVSLTKNADSDRIDALQTRVEALETAAGIPPAGAELDGVVPGTTVPPTDGTTLPDTGTTIPDTTIPPTDGTTLPDGTTDSGQIPGQ